MKKTTSAPAPEGLFNARSLGIPKMLLLGCQHMFAMFGATVLVPLLTGLDVSVTLLMAGLGTLLFHVICKGKVPAFLGSSFAFLGGYAAVAPMIDGLPNMEKLPYACGGVFFAGLVYLILAALIRIFGAKRVMRFFPPVVTGPIIISIGLILAPVAVQSCMPNPDVASTRFNWILALVAIITVIVFNIWGRGMMRIIPIILGVAASYVTALLLGVVDFGGVRDASIVGVPSFMIMKFDLSAIITIVPIALATMMEHIGDISAIGATTGKNYIANPGLHRTLIGDGVATSLASAFGGPANTTYGENTGVLALTKVYDPRVIQIAAVFATVFAFIPKISAVISSIPGATIGGISLILYGMISAVGVRNVVENRVDFTRSRNLIIAASILVCALGFNAVGGLTFSVGTADISLSGLAIAAIVGIILNAILPGNEYVFNTEEPDEKFSTFKV